MPAPKKKSAAKKAPAKKTTAKATAVKQEKITKQEDVLENVVEKTKSKFKNFKWEENIHMIVGILLLILGLWQLRQRLFGLILIIVGLLFVTGYFEKSGKKK